MWGFFWDDSETFYCRSWPFFLASCPCSSCDHLVPYSFTSSDRLLHIELLLLPRVLPAAAPTKQHDRVSFLIRGYCCLCLKHWQPTPPTLFGASCRDIFWWDFWYILVVYMCVFKKNRLRIANHSFEDINLTGLSFMGYNMRRHKKSGNRNHVTDGCWFSEIVQTWRQYGTFLNTDSLWRLCHTCARHQFPWSETLSLPYITFLCKRVRSDGTFPNLLMSFLWTFSFRTDHIVVYVWLISG